MQLTAKFVSVIILLLLSAPILLFNSCGGGSGSSFFTGGACGGCPNSTAPEGSSITASSSSISGKISANGVSPVEGCISHITFVVKDTNGPLPNICVELFTNGRIALTADPNDPGSCVTNKTYVRNYMRQRTDDKGAISLDFATDLITRATPTTLTTVVSRFIQANSCSVGNVVPGDWTVTW